MFRLPDCWHRLIPQSLSVRLLLAVIGSIVAAQLFSGLVYTFDRNALTAEWSALDWSERVGDLVTLLDSLDRQQRLQVVHELHQEYPQHAAAAPLPQPLNRGDQQFLRLFRSYMGQRLDGRSAVQIAAAQANVMPDVILANQRALRPLGPARFFDVQVGFADGQSVLLRLQVMPRMMAGANNVYLYPMALIIAIFVSISLVARGISRPLSRLADAADTLGRQLESRPLPEEGPRELRRAARAFNTMQDRLRRYLSSRTRVLTALSHDLRTPITRLMLRVEAVADPNVQAKLQQDLTAMQAMVKGTLDMLQGLETGEPLRPVDIEALVNAVRDDFVETGFPVTVEGRVAAPLLIRPQAMRRLLTNLLDNAQQFATSAAVMIGEDARGVQLIVQDDGPGIPQEQLELVMEPYYRVEGSRCRETGGVGLGLSIARDIAQGHGGTLVLCNGERGLQARIHLPRET